MINNKLLETAPSLISITRHLINEFLFNELKSNGFNNLSPSHGDILFTVFKSGPITMNEMAKRIKRDPSTVTTLVCKLKKLGYIELIENEKDGRSKLIALTDEGLKIKEVLFEISRKLHSNMWVDIPIEEQKAFVATLLKIQKNLH